MKGFYRYMSSRKMTRENVGLLMNRAGYMMAGDIDKAKVLKAFHFHFHW